MTKKKLFYELRICASVALNCPSYRSAYISICRADGMIKLAYAYDIINAKQFHTLCSLRREFENYLIDIKPYNAE